MLEKLEEKYRDIIEYRGVNIGVAQDYRFVVCESADPSKPGIRGAWFGSLAAAKEEVDDQLKSLAKAAKRKLAIPMLDESGKSIVLTGIHAQQNETMPKTAELYPPNPRLAALLQERAKHRQADQAITKEVNQFRVQTNRGWSRVKAEYYEDAITKLEAEIAERAKKLESY